MKFRNIKLILICSLLLSAGCSSKLNHTNGAINVKEEFSKLKALEGNWQSKPIPGSDQEKIAYKVTSGGNALQEVLFPGTPNEMLSVYYIEGTDLVMTHYCMLPNQPKLRAISTQDDKLTFELAPTAGINSATDQHMHSLTITLAGPDRLIQEWTSFKDGKPEHTKTIDLVRVR